MRSQATAAILVALALSTGCASPRYQTEYRLVAPTDPAAGPCLERCATVLNDCRSHCAEAREACLKTIDAEVDRAYAEALKGYAADLDRYRAELERYRFDLWLGWHHGYMWYDQWPYYYASAIAPAPPGREAVRNQVAKARCDADCGCQARHDACFIGCGGSKVEETRCIANCPPK